MPTANRRPFIRASINMFLAQTAGACELVILDDGEEEISDLVFLGHPRIRYYKEPHRSLGEKHNRLVELAKGDYILHWADDDYHAPWRIKYQVAILESNEADLTSCTDILRIDAGAKRAWHEYTDRLSGGCLAYRKEIWNKFKYPDVPHGEDNGFVDGQIESGSIAIPSGKYEFHVHRIHANNSYMQKKAIVEPSSEVPLEDVKAVIEPYFDEYFGGSDGLPK